MRTRLQMQGRSSKKLGDLFLVACLQMRRLHFSVAKNNDETEQFPAPSQLISITMTLTMFTTTLFPGPCFPLRFCATLDLRTSSTSSQPTNLLFQLWACRWLACCQKTARVKKVLIRGNVASLFGLSILRSYDFLAFPFRPEAALSASSHTSVLFSNSS